MEDSNNSEQQNYGGLYENIAAKKKRIENGSGETMKSKGDAGAPTNKNFKQAAKTAKKK